MPPPHRETGPVLKRELSFLPLAAVVFFNVSGGPYGIEDAVSSFSPGLTLLLLLVTPLIWSLPVALAMAELSSALPDEGGYVTWVKRAFGSFWAFQVGWWSWVGSFVDVALYPVLFVDYLSRWLPSLTALHRWSLVLAFVWILTALNIRGVRLVGWSAVLLGLVALSPVIGFAALGIDLAFLMETQGELSAAADATALAAASGLNVSLVEQDKTDEARRRAEEVCR